MLNLMPIPHVLHMKEINSMNYSNICGGHMFTGGPDEPNSHANNSKNSHG